MSHLRFDDETDRIAKYRLKATSNYLPSASYAGQYRYPIDYSNEPTTAYREERDERKDAAIQLKRSYPKNYQQYRLLRSRLPREPRERPLARSAERRESRNGLAARELASSSSSKDASKLLNNRSNDKALINRPGEQPAKASSSLGRRTGGDRILSSILSSKIVSLKDNEQITASKTTIGQRINFRSELLPNLVYNNLIRRAGAMDATRKPPPPPETRSEVKELKSTEISSEVQGGSEARSESIPVSGDATDNSRKQASNEQSINQTYIQRYSSSNQTVKNSNSTDLKRHLSDAVLLTNVKREESSNSNAAVSSNELPSILQSTLLAGDASSIQESLLPSINTSAILNLIRSLNLTNGSSDVESFSDAESSSDLAEPVKRLKLSTPNESDSDESSDDVRPKPTPKSDSTPRESIDSQQSSDDRSPSVPAGQAISSAMRIAKSASLYNPLELQLIKLAPTMGFNRI